MGRRADKLIDQFKSLLPAPFTIAVLLTAIAFALAFFLASEDATPTQKALNILDHWERGLWNSELMVFAMQMMLILVLGHVFALSRPVSKLINKTGHLIVTSTPRAVYFVTLMTMIVGLFNWGFGLIFGAILARKVGELASRSGLKLHYPLIGAAGYSGMMVWHGGLSGSSIIKAAEPGHLEGLVKGMNVAGEVPEVLSAGETLFSAMNIAATVLVLALVPAFMAWLGTRVKSQPVRLDVATDEYDAIPEDPPEGAEVLDRSFWPASLFGLLMIAMALYRAIAHPDTAGFGFISPNWINLLLFGMCLLFHGSIFRFLHGVDRAIGGAAGILIQFPLYFGVMGIITGSGLASDLAEWLMEVSTPLTYPVYTFLSAGLVNIFVPSGGGQWAIQGPLIVKAALEMDISLSKCVLAMAYGDQLTNMLQPFWALPLLGITGLKAKAIAPYTFLMMLAGGLIYLLMLLIF